jgi:drug/metabolite transporter (DMT)-like permease
VVLGLLGGAHHLDRGAAADGAVDRFFIAGAIGVALARALGQSWRLTPAQWRATVVFGVCQNALYLGLYWVAFQTVEASLAAIIASTMPLLVALAGWLVLGERLAPLGVAGLLAGFAGVALIMGARVQGGADPFGVTLCVIGVLALAVATLTMRGVSSGGNFLMVVGLQMVVGAVVLLPFALALEEVAVDWSWRLGLAYLYTILVPGLAATLVWFLLVHRIGAVKAALDLMGVTVIAFGILAVQLSKQRTVERARP